MPNIYQNIDENKRDTVVIIVVFIAVVSAVGWVIGQYYFQGSGISFIALALIFSGVSGLISYYNSDKMILYISGAHEVMREENDQLHDLVENMSIASGIPKPKIYMIDDTAMNAFATGRDPNHSVVCFTSGIVEKLDKTELEGVIAHEMSHIGNYDIRLASIVSVLVGTITLLADWFTRGMLWGGGGRRRGRGDGEVGGLLMILGIVLIILSPIIAALIQLALSRRREFLADATAAYITRYPKGLANALRKLAGDKEILEAANGATAHLYIVSPLREASGITGSLANLFNTHPPLEERIRRLETM
jgi:heat shock protein HtpX